MPDYQTLNVERETWREVNALKRDQSDTVDDVVRRLLECRMPDDVRARFHEIRREDETTEECFVRLLDHYEQGREEVPA